MEYNLSEIMKKAWGYRQEMSMSLAMKKAWDEAKTSIEALQSLKQDLLSQLDWVNNQLEAKQTNEFTLEANYYTDKRKGIPYVARIKGIDKEGKLIREFVNLDRDYDGNSVTVYGSYKAKPFEILEIREGGSWKNDYRYFFRVDEKGELEKICDATDKRTIKKILKGN